MKREKINWKTHILGVYLFLLLIGLGVVGMWTYLHPPKDKFIFFLLIIACSGGIGGTIYSIRSFYKNLVEGHFNFDRWIWWYIFRPVMSIVIGVFVYFLIAGGLLAIGDFSEINYSRGLMFCAAVAFLAGFSFTQFANKLDEISSTIFARKKK